MRYLLVFIMFTVCLSMAHGTPPVATGHATGLTITPFAVPVATPVTIAQPGEVFYMYQNQAVVSSGNYQNKDSELWAEFEQFQRWKAAQKKLTPTGINKNGAKQKRNATSETHSNNQSQNQLETLLKTSCYQCHSGTTAKGEFHFDRPLSANDRLKAIEQVVRGDMPKGKPLSAQQVGRVLLELSQTQNEVEK